MENAKKILLLMWFLEIVLVALSYVGFTMIPNFPLDILVVICVLGILLGFLILYVSDLKIVGRGESEIQT